MRAVMIVGTLTFSLAAHSSEIVADKPVLKLGDTWLYEINQTGTVPKSTAFYRDVSQVKANGEIHFSGPGENHLDSSLNPISPLGKEYNKIVLQFPMKVGSKWSYRRKVIPEYQDLEEIGSYEVVSYERLTVPAGTFDCFKIVGDVRADAQYWGKWIVSEKWYCPSIKQIAKEFVKHSERRNSNGRSTYNIATIVLLKTNYAQAEVAK